MSDTKISLLKVTTHGTEAFDEDDRFIGYDNIETSYHAVAEANMEEFLSRHEEDRVTTVVEDLPMPFAAAPVLMEALKFYADPEKWKEQETGIGMMASEIQMAGGVIAREALAKAS